MGKITKPSGALLGLGIVFLLIGFYMLDKSTSPPTIPNCIGAQNYYLNENLPEVTIDLKPNCWSGTVDFDVRYGLSWNTVDHRVPYEALFKDSYIYQGNRVVGLDRETVDHLPPIRFKGTGKMKVYIPIYRK